jgi:hypothetical protein
MSFIFTNSKGDFQTDGVTIGGNIAHNVEVLTIAGLAAASVSQSVFICDAAYQLVSVKEVHGTASTSGTLMVEKCTGTTAPGSGTACLTGTVSLAGTANTVVSGTLNTDASITFAAGDRVSLKFAGTMTNLVGCSVLLTFKRV